MPYDTTKLETFSQMTTLLRDLVHIKYKNRLSQMQEALKCRDVYLHLT